jgi:hypothetical protein
VPPGATDDSRTEVLWRWLGLTVGGTVLPFAILYLSYRLAAAGYPSFTAVLGRGELFIPASIMNAEAVWICKYLALPVKAVWYPIIIAACGLAALGGAICYGVTAALEEAPPESVKVTQATLHELARSVVILSASEFLMALLVGTIGVTLFMVVGGQEESARE